MKIIAIIQARLGSTRLPLKSLLCLRGQPIIDWVTGRTGQAQRLTGLIVATPRTPLDRLLQNHLKSKNIPVYAGPENDVLSRFCLAARYANADYIVRICADNPLVWAGAIDQLIGFYFDAKCDYAWNHIPRNNTWPDGLGAEMVSRQLLEHVANVATLPSQREHCFNYIWDHSDEFAMGTFNPLEPWLSRPDIKLDIDSVQDFELLGLLPINPAMDARAIIQAWDASPPSAA